jgi:hypothetical protein
VVLLLIASQPAATTYVWTPIATRVEKADLIVIGRVIADAEKKHVVPMKQGSPNEATLLVTEVLKGRLEFAHSVTGPDGKAIQTIRMLHYERMSAEDGNFSHISKDERFKDEINGIWILQRGDVPGTYSTGDPFALRLDDLEFVRRSLSTVDSKYANVKPGFAPDNRTWVATWVSESTHINACLHASGDISVCGSFSGDLEVSGQYALSSPEPERFLARLDAHGQVKWVRSMGSQQRFDAKPYPGLDGACLLVGEMNAPCSVLGTVMPWSGGRPQLIVCVSPDGNVKWARTLTEGARVSGLFRDKPGHVTGLSVIPIGSGYRMIGSFTGEVAYGDSHILARNGANWFIGTIDSEGQLQELHRIDRSGDEFVTSAVPGLAGQTILAGSMNGPGKADIFVAAVSATGQLLWIDTMGGRWEDWLTSLAIGADGSVLASVQITVPGPMGGDGRVYAGRQQNILWLWSPQGKRLRSIMGGGVADVKAGKDGRLCALGAYGAYWQESRKDMPPASGDLDLFLECYDRTGRRLWVRRDGGMSAEVPLELHLLPAHRALIVGAFDGTTFLAGQVLKARGLQSDGFLMNVPLPTGREQ